MPVFRAATESFDHGIEHDVRVPIAQIEEALKENPQLAQAFDAICAATQRSQKSVMQAMANSAKAIQRKAGWSKNSKAAISGIAAIRDMVRMLAMFVMPGWSTLGALGAHSVADGK